MKKIHKKTKTTNMGMCQNAGSAVNTPAKNPSKKTAKLQGLLLKKGGT